MNMPDRPRLLSDPPPRRMMRESQVDDLALAVVALTRELWVMCDRVAVLEATLEEKNLLSGGEVDCHIPAPALQAKLDNRRAALTATIANILSGGEFEAG